jgi:hypothetical protein
MKETLALARQRLLILGAKSTSPKKESDRLALIRIKDISFMSKTVTGIKSKLKSGRKCLQTIHTMRI